MYARPSRQQQRLAPERPPYRLALAGAVALALGLGLGRFAFTPLLPLMQMDAGVTILSASWLAAANYGGYLVGALIGVRWRLESPAAIRAALVVVAAVTLAMGLTDSYIGWLVLRTIAGVASAVVLVAVSAWTLFRLSASGYPAYGAIVFAGVGFGIFAAGTFVLGAMAVGVRSSHAWIVLGALALLITATAWNTLFRDDGASRSVPPPVRGGGRTLAHARVLVPCYGALGFAYIIPATFLPAAARQIVPDPMAFGWSWPLFGLAAVLSTIASVAMADRWTDRAIWTGSYVVMALGVALPAFVPGLVALLISGVVVGGTLSVITLVALREARAAAGPAAAQLIAAMTAAFATGQIIGPLVAGYLVEMQGTFATALVSAAVLLLASAAVLLLSPQIASDQVSKGRRSSS